MWKSGPLSASEASALNRLDDRVERLERPNVWPPLYAQRGPAGSAIGLDVAVLKNLLAAGGGIADAAVHCVAGANWPAVPDDVLFRGVKRNDLGVLIETSPVVEYGRPPKFVASAAAGSSTGNAVTTAGVDTTGATFLAVVVGWKSDTTADVTVTDSKGNTWVPCTARTSGLPLKCRIYYAMPGSPNVGAGHTFTATGASSFPTISVAAFRYLRTNPLDTENGATGSGVTTLATGPATPSTSYSVVITGLAADDTSGNVPTAAGFTVAASGQVAAQHYAGGLGWKILLSSAATSATWTWTNAGSAAAVIATFKGTGKVYEHANLPWRCVDPAGTVTHEFPLFEDSGGSLFAVWDEWYWKYTERVLASVAVSVTQDPVTCVYTTTTTNNYKCYDVIGSFWNTPSYLVVRVATPSTWNCVAGVCTEVTDCDNPGTYASLAACQAACP